MLAGFKQPFRNGSGKTGGFLSYKGSNIFVHQEFEFLKNRVPFLEFCANNVKKLFIFSALFGSIRAYGLLFGS